MQEKKELNQKTGRFNMQRKVPQHSARKIVYPIAFFILVNFACGINNVQAQKFYVQQKNGIQNEFLLEGLTKLTFPSGKVEISHTNGSTVSFDLENLRLMSFVDFTTDVIINKTAESFKIGVYPNPAEKVLNVNYETDKYGKFSFKIINLQGQTLAFKEIAGLAGKNEIEINLENLPKGMYFLKTQFQQKTITTKFFKQ